MKQLFSLILLLLIFASCKNEPVSGLKSNASRIDTLSAGGTQPYDVRGYILVDDFSDTTYQHFSDTASKDRFTIFIPKGNPYETSAILTIVNAGNEVIFSDTFPSFGIFNSSDIFNVKNQGDMEAFVRKRAKAVFDTNSFFDMGCKSRDFKILESRKEDFEDYTTYLEVKEQKRTFFCLWLFEENIVYYGYSQRLKKVVAVMTCC